MNTDIQEVEQVLRLHLEAIRENDVSTYHLTTSPDLTLYEWWVTPHRIEGLSFHDFMMESQSARGTVFGTQSSPASGTPSENQVRFDLANLKIQHFGDTAIASYTLLISAADRSGVVVTSHNESRVLVRQNNQWQVVHVHKSPAWPAPYEQP